MFVGYQSKARHWDIDPHINIPINMIAAHEIERLVSILPHKHRDALRWIYVWPWVPANKIRRELRVTFDELAGLICEGRDMVMAKLG